MPVTYPPAPPTLTGDVETINRFLQSPFLIQRALNTLAQNRFIADVLLQARVPATGGAILFEQSENIFADQTPEAIQPGAEYPLSGIGTGPALIAAVRKWGMDAIVTDEAIHTPADEPRRPGPHPKPVNSVVKQVDSVAMTAIGAAVTQTSAAAAHWDTSTTLIRRSPPLVAGIHALNQGYDPDTVVVSDTVGGFLTGNDKLLSLCPVSGSTEPIYAGYLLGS